MSKEKYNLLKRKLKELLQENSFLTEKVEKQSLKIKSLGVEKDLLLERLQKDEEAAKEFLSLHQRAPSDGSVSDVEMSLESELKKKKKAKKTLKIKKIQPVVTGEDGQPVYPIKLGLLSLENLGVIVYDRDSFHNERYLYPVGYKITRDYWSTRDPESVVTFTCEIRDGGSGPSFIVTPSDFPQDQVVSSSPTGAWAQIFKLACELRNAEPPKATAGPEYFGFTQPTIAYLIEQLPNANLCKNYQKQLFEVSNKKRSYTPRSKKKDMVNDSIENGDAQSDMKMSFISNAPTENTENANGSFDMSTMERLPKIEMNGFAALYMRPAQSNSGAHQMRPPNSNQMRAWSPSMRPLHPSSNSFSGNGEDHFVQPQVKRQFKISRPLKKLKVSRNLDDIEILGQVGEGTYGKVFKAIDKCTNEYVALKKMVLKEEEKGKDKHKDGFPITSIREIRILRKLSHPNIVQLMAMVVIPNIEDPMLYMVFEYIDHDLTGLLNHPDIQLEPKHIKCIARQIFEGVEHLHQHNIMHRDIKGANLLLSKQGVLKIADFGLARELQIDFYTHTIKENFEYTNRVVTLWYRSPELLLGSTLYGFAVDLWSIGCIFLELFSKTPIFQGKTEIEQCEAIFKVCGTPNAETWPDLVNMNWYNLVKFENYPPRMKAAFARYNLTDMCFNLVQQLLTIDPSKRPTIGDALLHPYWSEEPKACERHEIPQVQGDWHEFESKVRRKGGPGSEVLPRLVSPQQSSTSSLPIQKQDETQLGENISRKRHITPDESLKKKRKEIYNRALIYPPSETNHYTGLYQSHNTFTAPMNPNLMPVDKDVFCSFDHYYCDD